MPLLAVRAVQSMRQELKTVAEGELLMNNLKKISLTSARFCFPFRYEFGRKMLADR